MADRRRFKLLVVGLTSLSLGCKSTEPPAAAQLAFGTISSPVVAGSSIPAITVTVQDASGAKVASSTAEVTIRLAPGTNALLFGGTLQPAVNGVASFVGLSLPSAGTFSFIAESPGLASAQSGNIVVTAGPANKLSFVTQPVNTPAGTAFTVVVAIKDLFGNNTIGAGTVSVTLNQPSGTGATLSGTTTVSAMNGSATFNLSIDKPGQFSLGATSPGLTSVTSLGFTITP